MTDRRATSESGAAGEETSPPVAAPVSAKRQRSPFEKAIAKVYGRHRGTKLTNVLDSAAEDMIVLVEYLEAADYDAPPTAVIRQFCEIWAVMKECVRELDRQASDDGRLPS